MYATVTMSLLIGTIGCNQHETPALSEPLIECVKLLCIDDRVPGISSLAALPQSATLTDVERIHFKGVSSAITAFTIADSDELPSTLRYPALAQSTDDGSFFFIAGWSSIEHKVLVITDSGVETLSWNECLQRAVNNQFLTFTTSATRQGRIWVPCGRIDLGIITAYTNSPHSVLILNPGDTPIEILSQRFSCKCANGHVASTRVNAHEYTRLNINLDLSQTQRPTVSLKWLVVTDTFGSQLFEVAGAIGHPLELSPAKVSLGDVSPNDTSRQVGITIMAGDELSDPEEIEPVDLDPGIKWGGVSRTEGGFTVNLLVMIREAHLDNSGGFSLFGTLRIGRDLAIIRTFNISGRLLPWIEIYPSIINIGDVRPGATIKRIAKVVCRCTGDARLTTSVPQVVKAVFDQDTIVIEFTAPVASGTFNIPLLFRVGMESVMIPIRGTVVAQDAAAPTE